MESQPKPEASPFEKTTALMRRIISVPKSEIDKRAEQDRQRRKRVKGRN